MSETTTTTLLRFSVDFNAVGRLGVDDGELWVSGWNTPILLPSVGDTVELYDEDDLTYFAAVVRLDPRNGFVCRIGQRRPQEATA